MAVNFAWNNGADWVQEAVPMGIPTFDSIVLLWGDQHGSLPRVPVIRAVGSSRNAFSFVYYAWRTEPVKDMLETFDSDNAASSAAGDSLDLQSGQRTMIPHGAMPIVVALSGKNNLFYQPQSRT